MRTPRTHPTGPPFRVSPSLRPPRLCSEASVEAFFSDDRVWYYLMRDVKPGEVGPPFLRYFCQSPIGEARAEVFGGSTRADSWSM